MSESITLPAHIENGSIHIDAPLPPNAVSVEVRVLLARDTVRRSVSEVLRSLPPGTKTAEELGKEIAELRADR